MSFNAKNNYKELAVTEDKFYVLSDGNGRYFVRDFDKPSTKHAMFCSNDIRDATRYESEEKANMAKSSVLAWHGSAGDSHLLAQDVVNSCKTVCIYHTERFEVPKETMVRDAGFDKTANAFSEIFGG